MKSLSIVVLLFPTVVLAQSIRDLESSFVQDQSHDFVYRVQNLPDDVRDIVYRIVGTEHIANYGQFYHKTDVIRGDYPMDQHQFSLISSETVAILY